MKQQKFSEKKIHSLNESKDELVSLNHELYDEFTIIELEERLETKPWICGAHVDNPCPTADCIVNTAPSPQPEPTPEPTPPPTPPTVGQ